MPIVVGLVVAAVLGIPCWIAATRNRRALLHGEDAERSQAMTRLTEAGLIVLVVFGLLGGCGGYALEGVARSDAPNGATNAELTTAALLGLLPAVVTGAVIALVRWRRMPRTLLVLTVAAPVLPVLLFVVEALVYNRFLA